MSIITPSDNGASLTEHQIKRQMAMQATIGDVNEIAFEHARKQVHNLGNQIPDLVRDMCHAMIAEAMAGFVDALQERFVMVPRTAGVAKVEGGAIYEDTVTVDHG